MDTVYRNRRGYAAIFCYVSYGNGPRPQAIEDVIRLVDLLPQFGYDVAVMEIDPSVETTELYLDKWESDRQNLLSSYDSFLLIVSAHGNETSIAPISGRALFPYSAFEQALDRCRNLQNKPKWILFSTCNGGRLNHGLDCGTGIREVDQDPTGDGGPRRAEMCDILVSYAAVKGFSASRTSNGTFFLMCFTETLAEVLKHVSSDDVPAERRQYNIEKLMRRVNQKMKFKEVQQNCGIYQMSESISRLTKKFCLFYSEQRGTSNGTIDSWKRQLEEVKKIIITTIRLRVAGSRELENFLNPNHNDYDESIVYYRQIIDSQVAVDQVNQLPLPENHLVSEMSQLNVASQSSIDD